jgi:hypothetical protein
MVGAAALYVALICNPPTVTHELLEPRVVNAECVKNAIYAITIRNEVEVLSDVIQVAAEGVKLSRPNYMTIFTDGYLYRGYKCTYVLHSVL